MKYTFLKVSKSIPSRKHTYPSPIIKTLHFTCQPLPCKNPIYQYENRPGSRPGQTKFGVRAEHRTTSHLPPSFLCGLSMSLFLECLIIDYLPYLTFYLGISWFSFFSSLVWFGLVRCLLFVVVCPHRIRVRCHATGTVCRSFDLVG